jgi:hypothetical protein
MADVSSRDMAKKPMNGWMEVADDVFSDVFSCQCEE